MRVVLEMLEVVLTEQHVPSDLLNEQVKGIVIDLIMILYCLLKVFECSLRRDLHLLSFLGLLGLKMDQQDRILLDHHVKSIIINRLRPIPTNSQVSPYYFPYKNAYLSFIRSLDLYSFLN